VVVVVLVVVVWCAECVSKVVGHDEVDVVVVLADPLTASPVEVAEYEDEDE
jgi:hypothetical protein